MEQAHDVQNVFMQNASVPSASIQPQDWAKLIRKLRWIGMEDEACRLQMAVCSLPAEQRGTVSAGPFSTD
jgi:hypothetical protein